MHALDEPRVGVWYWEICMHAWVLNRLRVEYMEMWVPDIYDYDGPGVGFLR